jgi:hypothetical protein
MAKNRIEVVGKNKEGEEITVYVVRPDRNNNAQAQILASKVFKDAVLNGALVRKVLEDVLIKLGIWNSEKQGKADALDAEIREKLIKLKSGGIKLTDARELAIEIRIARMNKSILVSEKNAHDEFTAESQSENAKFDYLASVCIKDDEGKSIFTDIEDYKEKADEPYVIEASTKLGSMLYGLDDDWEANLPENTFLSKYEFVDKELRLVNKDGKHVTKDGKLIDNDFRYINAEGEYVDVDGNRIDKDGLPPVQFSAFLDDDGNPIKEKVEGEIVEEVVEDSPIIPPTKTKKIKS